MRINAVPRHMLQMEPCSHAAMEQWHQYEQTAGSGVGQPSLKQPGTCIYISRSSMAAVSAVGRFKQECMPWLSPIRRGGLLGVQRWAASDGQQQS